MPRNGKIVTPLRDAMADKKCKGVKFYCRDQLHAESVRVCAYIAGIQRDGFKFKTHRSGNELTVYKEGVDIWEGGKYIHVDLRD